MKFLSSAVNTNTFVGPSFGLANRTARFAWSCVWLFLFRPSPPPFHIWRSFLLRIFGARIGANVHIYPGARIWAPWNFVCGHNVGVADGVNIYSMAKIEVGNFVVISQGSHLCSGTHNYEHPGHPLVTRPILIGNNVWIAADVFVHPGVRIEDGVVVGARSVVTRDLPGWKVCFGHPCIPRFSRNYKK